MAGDLAVVVFVEFLVASLGVESFSPSEVFFEGEDVVFVGVPSVEWEIALSFGFILRLGLFTHLSCNSACVPS